MTLNKTEIIVASITALILFYIIIPKNEQQIEKEEIMVETPAIEAWKDTHEKWDGTEGDI